MNEKEVAKRYDQSRRTWLQIVSKVGVLVKERERETETETETETEREKP